MTTSFGNCSLYLCPKQHNFSVEQITPFIAALQKTGLIAQQINSPDTNQHYFSGDRFLDYIAYMGCAPAIQFEADDSGSNFCFIKIHPLQTPQLIFSQKQSRAPHCPNCKKPVKNWQQHISDATILCDSCNTLSNIETFDWRKMAGYASLFIEITDIFPKEATPQQLLLDKLADITGTQWQYFYSCE